MILRLFFHPLHFFPILDSPAGPGDGSSGGRLFMRLPAFQVQTAGVITQGPGSQMKGLDVAYGDREGGSVPLLRRPSVLASGVGSAPPCPEGHCRVRNALVLSPSRPFTQGETEAPAWGRVNQVSQPGMLVGNVSQKQCMTQRRRSQDRKRQRRDMGGAPNRGSTEDRVTVATSRGLEAER